MSTMITRSASIAAHASRSVRTPPSTKAALNGTTRSAARGDRGRYLYIVPEKCTECVGFFDQEQCRQCVRLTAVCPTLMILRLRNS